MGDLRQLLEVDLPAVVAVEVGLLRGFHLLQPQRQRQALLCQVGEDFGLHVVMSLEGMALTQVNRAGRGQVVQHVLIPHRLALIGVDPQAAALGVGRLAGGR